MLMSTTLDNVPKLGEGERLLRTYLLRVPEVIECQPVQVRDGRNIELMTMSTAAHTARRTPHAAQAPSHYSVQSPDNSRASKHLAGTYK